MKPLTTSARATMLALFLFFTSCRKQEKEIQVEPPTPTSVTDPSFFSKYATQDPVVQKVITYVKKQNEAYNFAPKYHKVIGLPRWDKAIVVGKGGSTTSRVTTGGNSDTSMVYVPFAQDSQQVVNAALIVKLAGDSISSRMLFKWQYSFFGYKKKPGNAWNAKDVFNLFVKLDNTVFGTTKFKVFNYHFLPEDIQAGVSKEEFARGDFDVTFTLNNQANNLASGRTVFVDICNTYDICLEREKKAFREIQSQSAMLPRCIRWGTETQCTTYWFTVSDDPNEGGGGWGDPGWWNTGGGGGGGSYWPSPDNPGSCPPEGGDRPPQSTIDDTAEPCGPGWIPQPPELKDANGFYLSRKMELAAILANNPAALLPCDEIANMEAYGLQWQNIASFQLPQNLKDRLDNLSTQVISNPFGPDHYYQQTLDNAEGGIVNCDYFPIKITSIPQGHTPESLLEHFRLNISDFITDHSKNTFEPYVVGCDPMGNFCVDDREWYTRSKENAVGSLVHIKIRSDLAPDDYPLDGTVILSNYTVKEPPTYSSYFNQFMFTTIYSLMDKEHPVAGNRAFGIFSNPNAAGEYILYMSGVDRAWSKADQLINWAMNGISFTEGDKLWEDVQQNFIKWVNNLPGGKADYFSKKKIVSRPDWDDVKKFLKKEITFNELKNRLNC